MNAAWWRDYRRRRSAELREYNRARRRQAKVRAQRHAQEARRRARRRVEAVIPGLHVGHELFEQARAIVRDITPMAVLKSRVELDREDARSEAVLAALEERDPELAAIGYLRSEATWRRLTRPLLGEVA